MSNAPLSVTTEENGKSPCAVTIKSSGHTIMGDLPESWGGANTGPSPDDLLTSAVGECASMTIRLYALQHKWPLGKVIVNVTHEMGNTFIKKVTLIGDTLSYDQRKALIDVANKCPTQKILENKSVIETRENLDH